MHNLIIFDDRFGIHTSLTQIMGIFEYLIKNKNFKQINLSEIIGQPDVHHLFINKFAELPKNIIFWYNKFFDLNLQALPKSINIHLLIDDIHQEYDDHSKTLNILKQSKNIFASYAYLFNTFYPEIIDTNVIFFPHSTRFIADFNDTPINKILVSGRLHHKIYPDRQKLYELSKTNNQKIDYLNVNVGYRIKKDHPNLIYGDRYIHYLNKYLVCFTCESNRAYLLKKFFEIPASGSLLLTINPFTKKYFVELGFVDGVHYLSATNDNIEEKINFVLDPVNRNIIDTIRKNGYELVKTKHTHVNRAEFLNNIIN